MTRRMQPDHHRTGEENATKLSMTKLGSQESLLRRRRRRNSTLADLFGPVLLQALVLWLASFTPTLMAQVPSNGQAAPNTPTPRIASDESTLMRGSQPQPGLTLPTDPALSVGVTVDAFVERWADPGYLVIRTRLTNNSGASSSNQSFTLECVTGIDGSYPQDRQVTNRISLQLPQGQVSASETHRVPSYSVTRGVAFRVLQGGRELPGYSDQIERFGNFSNPFRVLTDWTRKEQSGPTIRLGDGNLESFAAACRSATNVSATFEEIVSLEPDSTPAGALRGLLLRGGILVVSDAEFSPRPATRLENQDCLQTVRNRLGLDFSQLGQSTNPGDGSRILRAGVGPGQIFVTEGDGAGLPSSATVTAMPTINRGVDPILGNARYRNWLIAGVAQPPVYTFMGLLAAFVVLVGPIAYRKSMRAGRGYLIFAVAPLLAALTTVSMFTYGIVADGFGTIVRIRQLTYVDGQSGDAGERIRSTYFAGIRPGDGLRFDEHDEVYPSNFDARRSWESVQSATPESMGTVKFESGKQVFSSDFLPSRRQRQFIAVRNRQRLGGLSAVGTPDGCKVTNHFDFSLRRLIVRDQTGEYHAIERLAPGETQIGVPLPSAEVSKQLGAMFNDFRPVAENTATNKRQKKDRQTRDLIAELNGKNRTTQELVFDGVFESRLESLLKFDAQLGNQQFVALSDVTSDVVAIPNAELVDSVRYLFGTLSNREPEDE